MGASIQRPGPGPRLGKTTLQRARRWLGATLQHASGWGPSIQGAGPGPGRGDINAATSCSSGLGPSMVHTAFSLQSEGDGQDPMSAGVSPRDESVDPGFAGLSFTYGCRQRSDIVDILEGHRPMSYGGSRPPEEARLRTGGTDRQPRGDASKSSGRPYSPSLELSSSPFCAPGAARPSPDRLQGEPRRQRTVASLAVQERSPTRSSHQPPAVNYLPLFDKGEFSIKVHFRSVPSRGIHHSQSGYK